MSKMVVPQGWEWDDSETSNDGAFRVHQLTVAQCSVYGRTEKEVLDELLHLWYGQAANSPATLVAHNLDFDRQLIAIAIARYYPGEAALLAAWLESSGVCTMKGNKERVDARTVKGTKKYPNLKETYKFFMGEELDNHHSANADCVACFQIYCVMQEC
jgi:DNA polymerase-3 subunit epsilon